MTCQLFLIGPASEHLYRPRQLAHGACGQPRRSWITYVRDLRSMISMAAGKKSPADAGQSDSRNASPLGTRMATLLELVGKRRSAAPPSLNTDQLRCLRTEARGIMQALYENVRLLI